MEFTAHNSLGCFLVTFFLVNPIPSSELFTVHSPDGPLVALVGEEAKLHCYISPAQNAEHMEVYWYHKSFIKPLQLYKRGNDNYSETSLNNTQRTEILKEDIGEGNITLRIQNVSVSDGGKYRCLFKDGNFTKEAVLELKVLAPKLELEMEVNIFQGIKIKCFSGGWFPQPQIQWVNSRGELLPPSSKSESLDEAGLFYMHISLVLEQSQGMITCWLQHPVTGQEKRTSIQVADIIFQQHDVQKLIYVYGLCMFIFMIIAAILIFLQYKCGRKFVLKVSAFLWFFVKVITLMATPSIICYTILHACVTFGIQDSQLPVKRNLMKHILLNAFMVMTTTSVFILLPYF